MPSSCRLCPLLDARWPLRSPPVPPPPPRSRPIPAGAGAPCVYAAWLPNVCLPTVPAGACAAQLPPVAPALAHQLPPASPPAVAPLAVLSRSAVWTRAAPRRSSLCPSSHHLSASTCRPPAPEHARRLCVCPRVAFAPSCAAQLRSLLRLAPSLRAGQGCAPGAQTVRAPAR